MGTLLFIVKFLVGLVLIIKGADWLTDGASAIARRFSIPSLVIGLTIVAFGTSAPELVVSVVSAIERKTEMAIGNAVGSVTANTALIMAIAMIAMSITCLRKQYLQQILLLIAAATGVYVFCLPGELGLFGGVVLMLILILFMTSNIVSARREAKAAAEAEEGEKQRESKLRIFLHILLFIVGAAAIVIGSRLMVDNGSQIAARLGVPERIIAVTMIAVGTSLPELVTTVTAIIKKESALSIGNVIGANIIDLTLILPLCSLVSGRPLPVSGSSLTLDLPVCLGATLIAVVPLIIRQKSSRVQGIVLLAGYIAYVVLVVVN